MKIRIDELKDKSVELSDEEAVAAFPSLQALQEAGECLFLAPVRTHLTVAREFDHIRVSGRTETSLRLNCSRCLAEYKVAINSPFTIFYMKARELDQDEDVELSEEDMISATYEGDEIDFSYEIAEQILLAIPFKPLCREECRGLCPSCGTDLNSSDCTCSRQEMNFKLSALKDFKIDS